MVNPILVYLNGDPIHLTKCKGLGETEDVEMFVVLCSEPLRTRKLRVASEIRKAIIEVLQRYHDVDDLTFDCYAFVCLAHGIDRSHKVSSYCNFWELRPPRKRKKIGDVIFLLGKTSSDFRHAGLYIGCGLYLSIYGAGGHLEVASLPDMQTFYRSKLVRLAVPRK